MLSAATRDKLKTVSTATVCTALFKRGFRNQYIQDVRPLNPAAGPMVGEAFTLRYIPAREDLDQISAFDSPEHPQRKAIESVPPGQVLVMDCRRETRAASGGHILLTRLKVRGAAGVVTDGCLRDSEAIAAMDYPIYGAGGSAPLNLVCHHAVDINVPIGCGGVAVFPGDTIVGDGEGVVVIPQAMVADVARDAHEQEIMEQFVLLEIEQGRALPGTYPPNAATLARYQQWRARRDGDR
jgi:regulator of RNase E activity RraA